MNDEHNRYAAPMTRPAPGWNELDPSSRPGVVLWFKIYAGFLAAIYVLTALAMLVLIVVGPQEPVDPEEAMFTGIFGGVLIFVCGLLALLFGAALFLPRRPWVWIYDIVLIALGMTSCPSVLASIPLLIFWLKPETQRYFGRGAGG